MMTTDGDIGQATQLHLSPIWRLAIVLALFASLAALQISHDALEAAARDVHAEPDCRRNVHVAPGIRRGERIVVDVERALEYVAAEGLRRVPVRDQPAAVGSPGGRRSVSGASGTAGS